MQRWRARLESLGRVVTFEYPYMRAGVRRPDRLPKLVESHREALDEARSGHEGPVVLAGKSMGGRVGCHLALEEAVDAVVCFGYPLKGMGRTAKPRDEVLLALETRILFLQGTRDKLCPLDLLEDVRIRMQAENELFVVEAGDHGLEVTKTWLAQAGETQDDVDDRILAAVGSFLAG